MDLSGITGYVALDGVSSITAVANKTVNQVVYLYPTTLTVDPNAPQDDLTTGVVTPKEPNTTISTTDPNGAVYPSGISTSDLVKTVTETINYVDVNGTPLTTVPTNAIKTQDVTFTRTATVTFSKDADGKVIATAVPGDWQVKPGDDGQFKEVSQAIDGYTEVNTAPQVVLDSTNEDNLKNFDETLYYAADTDLQHNVTVTTHYNVPAGKTAIEDVTTTIPFYRVYTLGAEGKPVAQPWTTNTTGISTSPADLSKMTGAIDTKNNISGYTMTTSTDIDGVKATGANVKVTGDMTLITRTVNYADKYVHVTYVDVTTKQQVATINAAPGGYTTRSTEYATQVMLPDGTTSSNYELVTTAGDDEAGQFSDNSDTTGITESFTGVAGQTIVVEVQPVHVKSEQTTHRVITYVVADGAVPAPETTVTQTANWTEDINVALYGANPTDPDAISYTQTTGYPKQVSEELPEYTVDKATVPAEATDATSVSALPADEAETVTYNRYLFTPENPGDYDLTVNSKRIVQYVTNGGQSVKADDPAQVVTFNRTYNQTTDAYTDWTTTDGTFDAVPVTQMATVNGVAYVTPEVQVPEETAVMPANDKVVSDSTSTEVVTYYPASVTVPSTGQNPGDDTVPNDANSPKIPAGVTQGDLNKTITETINYVVADGKVTAPATAHATTTYARTATVTYTVATDGSGKLVPEVNYGKWTATDDKFESVTSPTVTGYLADVQATPETELLASAVKEDVHDDSLDFTTTVTYYPTQVTVTPDQPKDQNTPTINGDDNSPLYPAGLTADMLNKTITETINYVDDKGTVLRDPTSDQKVNFTRTATVTYKPGADGKLTGTVAYTPWTVAGSTDTDGVFAAVEAPVIAGYTAPAGQVGQVTKTVDDADFEKTITYFNNSDLTKPVPVTTHYDAYTAEGATDETPAQDVTDATVVFYHQPTYDAAGTYGFTDWTTNASGQSQATSDLTSNVAPIDATVPAGFHLLVKTTYTDAATGQTSTTTTTDPNATGVEVKSTYSAVARDVSYVQDYYNITFVDVNDPANPVTLGTTQQVGDPYEAGSTTVPDWGLLKIADTGTYLSEEGGTIDPDTGAETFTATPDGNYTIQLVHASDDNQTTTTRNIVYQLADGTQVAPSVSQKETWTGNTDLYISAKDSNIGVTPTTLYTQTSAYGAQDSPLTGTFTGKDGKTYDLSEYTPDIKTVAAATLQSGSTTDTPSNAADVVVTYTRTTFTPENPGDYANQLTSTSTRTIHYVDGTDQTKDELAPSVTQTVTFERNYNVTTGFSDWTVADESTTDGSTDGTYAEQSIPTIPGYVTTATSTPTELAVQGATPEDVDVTYYPTTVTVTPDAPKTTTDHVTTDPNSPTYPEGVSETDLNRIVTETIHYVDGTDPNKTVYGDFTAQIPFSRTATVDYANLTDGKPTVTYGEWVANDTGDGSDTATDNASATFDPVASEKADGYLKPADTAKQTVNADSPNVELTVNYYPTTVQVPANGSHLEGDSTVPDDVNSPTYPAGVSDSDLNQQAVETIRFLDDGNGAQLLEPVVQTLNLTRDAIITYSDDGAPTVTYTDWTDGADNTFPMLVSPKIAGMTPKQANVPALVETDPAPVTATIYYVKDTGAGAGTGTGTNGGGTNTTTTTPGTPTDSGETPTATPENPAGTLQTPETTPTNQPQTPTGKAETPLANPVQKPAGKTETPVATPAPKPGATPAQQPVATPVNEPEAQPTPTSTKTTPTTQQPTAEAAAKTLPQTNDEQNATTSLLGLVGLSFLGMFGLGKKRKRED